MERPVKIGFTIIELVVVLGVLAITLAVASLNLTGIQNKTYLTTTVSTVVADIKKQQIKAMTGATEGRSDHDAYGIYFEADRYTLFHGAAYSPSELSNSVVMLENNVHVSANTFPSDEIVFDAISGEVEGFTAGQDTITLTNINTNEAKTITINRYGVVTDIN